jgi:hypothetical protein
VEIRRHYFSKELTADYHGRIYFQGSIIFTKTQLPIIMQNPNADSHAK